MIYAVFLISALLAFTAEKKDCRIYLGLLIFVVSAFVGTRTQNVGVDTSMYYSILGYLKKDIWSQNVEKGFLIICYCLLKVMDTEQILLLFAFVTNSLILIRLWSFRDRESFFLMAMLYLLLFYSETANIFRQYVAVAIVFFATYYLEKGKPVKFLIALLAAMLFHRTALLGVAYLPLYYLIKTERFGKRIWIELAGLAALAAAAALVLTYKDGRYLKIYASGELRIGLLFPARLLVLGVYLYANIRKIGAFRYQDELVHTRQISVFYTLGIVLSSAGYYQHSLYRLGLYYILFETVFIPHVCTKGHNRRVFSIIYLALVLYMIYNNWATGWSGLANYSSWLA